MFHRPKPEIEKESEKQQEVQQQEASVQKTEQAQDVAPVVREAAVEAAPQPTQQQTIATSQVKEEKVMSNDQSDNREAEARSMEAPAGVPFQRPPQMQRGVPGGFSGGYTTAPAQGGYDVGDSRGSAEDRRLVIGQGITMSGEIEACDYLLVEGTLEAALKGAKVLEIAASGTFYGGVEIEEATVAGRFEGDLTVNGRLTIKSGGSVTGSIAYKELAIEAGAILDGKVSPLAGGVAKSEAPKKTMAPRNDNAGQEGSSSSELPFSGGRVAAAE